MGFYLQGKETWESGGPPPLSRGTTYLPTHCSVKGKELEAVEVKTGQEPDPK
jgi:hypothetical protein